MNPELAQANRARVEELRRAHRTDFVARLFTDIVGSPALKQQVGDGPLLGPIPKPRGVATRRQFDPARTGLDRRERD